MTLSRKPKTTRQTLKLPYTPKPLCPKPQVIAVNVDGVVECPGWIFESVPQVPGVQGEFGLVL